MVVNVTMEMVKELIKQLTGYIVQSYDEPLLEFIYNSEQQHILNDCNVSELPEQLQYIVHERTIGQYIGMKLTDILGADNLNVVTSIKEGDTTVEIGGISNEERLNSLTGHFMRSRGRDIACFRRLKW